MAIRSSAPARNERWYSKSSACCRGEPWQRTLNWAWRSKEFQPPSGQSVLARALATEPDVLLMDEPFAALDAQTRDLMQTELLQVWERTKKTVLFVTHSIEEAAYLSDRVVIMTARPGRAKDMLVVQLPRPREYEMRLTPEFNEIKSRIWEVLKEELT